MKKRSPLVIENLKVWIEGKEVVRGVSLTVEPGAVHALMGPNGTGKSSMALALMGHPRYTEVEGTVRIDDIHVHPRDNDLVVGTHGLSIYIIDDVTPLQQLTPGVMAGDAHLFEVREAVRWKSDTQMSVTTGGSKQFRGQNPAPGTAISYYLPIDLDGEVTLTITDMAGETVRTMTGPGERGINRVQWNLRGDPPPQPEGAQQAGFRGGQRQGPAMDPGTYMVTLEVGGMEMTQSILVLEDIWMRETH